MLLITDETQEAYKEKKTKEKIKQKEKQQKLKIKQREELFHASELFINAS